MLAVWIAIGVLLAVCIYDLAEYGTLHQAGALAALIGAVVVVILVLLVARLEEGHRRKLEDAANKVDGDSEFGVGDAFFNGDETFRRAKLTLTLLAVLVIGAVLPTIAIFAATDAQTFVSLQGGLQVQQGSESRLVSRLIQATYVAVLSLFPALLYFQFDRQRVGTIRGKWIRSIFRMDHRMQTLADVNARYGDELAEASTYSTDSVRFLGGRHSPIVVATILISLGWTLLVLRTDSFDFSQSSDRLFQLLVPTPSAATMAFLGAYFFGVYLILRGYFRGDLRPKIYNQITARLVTVVVLAYLINVVLVDANEPNEPIWVLSFLAGIVPTLVLQRFGLLAMSMGGTVAKTVGFGDAFAQAFATPRPLTQIDGVDLQEASRLDSEGIPDVASLARSDLVSVMVNTRLPVERIIDWTDQAVLILLLDPGDGDSIDPRLEALRKMGLRTASSVLAVADGRPTAPSTGQRPASVPEPLPTTRELAQECLAELPLDLLAAQIRREPAMGRIRQWYRSELADITGAWPTIEVPPPPKPAARFTSGHTANGHTTNGHTTRKVDR